MILSGKILFDPKDITKKHHKQSEWKRTAMVVFPKSEYDGVWRWYLKKRFDINLEKPLRNAHVTFINDRYNNIDVWNSISQQYNGKRIQMTIDNTLRSNGEHWWLKLDKFPDVLYDIRNKLNLRRDPYFKPHFTIGLANWKNEGHSNYIRNLLINNPTYT